MLFEDLTLVKAEGMVKIPWAWIGVRTGVSDLVRGVRRAVVGLVKVRSGPDLGSGVLRADVAVVLWLLLAQW